MDWNELATSRYLKPAMVALLTGYPQPLQRKWAERHFDFRKVPALWNLPPLQNDPADRWYSWIGVQMLALFGDVLTDLKDSAEARAALMIDPIPHLIRTPGDIFRHDFRRNGENNDLLIVRDLAREDYFYGTCGAKNLRIGDRLYIYNLSALQRRLVKRLEAIDAERGESEAA